MDLSQLSDEELIALRNQLQSNPLPDHPTRLPKQSKGDRALGFTRSVLDGLTMGYAGEIGSGVVAAVTPDATYRDIKGEYDKQQNKFQKRNPELDILGNAIGGLAGGGKIANTVMKTPFARANPIKASGITGGTSGAVAGAGYAPTMDDVPQYSTLGALFGTTLGAGSIPVGNTIGKISDNVKKKLSFDSPDKSASKIMNEYLSYDMLSPDQLLTNTRKLGSQATLSDGGGESIKSLSRFALQTPGINREAAYNSLHNRQSGSYDRVLDSLKTLSGGDTKYYQNLKSIIDRRRNEAAPLYRNAQDTSVEGDKMVDYVLRLNEETKSFEPLTKVLKLFVAGKGDDKRIKSSNIELHGVKRQLDDIINNAYKKGNGNLGEAAVKWRNELLRLMDEASPDYAQARKIYADESALKNALESGRNILKEDADYITDNLRNLSIAEQESYINGAVKTIKDRLMNSKEDKNVATKLSTRLVRERLRNAFPDDDSFNAFIKQLDIEDEYARTFQTIYGGSQTQNKFQTEQNVKNILNGDEVLAGTALDTLKNTIKTVLGKDDLPQETIDSISKLLYTPIGDLTDAQVRMLRRYEISIDDLYRVKGQIPMALENAVMGGVMNKSQSK